jgi:T5orf172 domain
MESAEMGLDASVLSACEPEETTDWDALERDNPIMRQANMNLGIVYFVEAPEVRRIKVGYTKSGISQRVSALRTGSPAEIRVRGYIYGSVSVERDIHAKFRHARFGREWFNETEDLAAFIREIAIQWEDGSGDPPSYNVTQRNFYAVVEPATLWIDSWVFDPLADCGQAMGFKPGAKMNHPSPVGVIPLTRDQAEGMTPEQIWARARAHDAGTLA